MTNASSGQCTTVCKQLKNRPVIAELLSLLGTAICRMNFKKLFVQNSSQEHVKKMRDTKQQQRGSKN
jgi:hypothetical protein